MNRSYWETTHHPTYPTLGEDIRCGFAVIGGGLCGVLTAYLLGKRGLDTVLVEKDRLGGGKTAGTTAKATVCHGLALSRIRRARGKEAAEAYATANGHGLRLLRELLAEEGKGDECDCGVSDLFLYSVYGKRRITEEYDCMKACGIDCTLLEGTRDGFELPLDVQSAIRVGEQLQFHPIKAVQSIARRINGRVYEGTEAQSIVKTAAGYLIKTAQGHIIRAAKVIVTTNYPTLVPKNMSFLKLYGETTYAAALANAPALCHMYYGIDGSYAYRSHGDVLIVSGERHRESPVPNAASRLTAEAQRLFPGATELAAWSNNDCYTHDGFPYAGEVGEGIFLASGFNGWGMTTSAACAMVLSYLAAGEVPPQSGIFSPSRNILKGGGESLLHHMVIAASGTAKRLSVPEQTSADLPRGVAAIVSRNGHRTGAYRDENGILHTVRPICPHMGCSLQWNPAAKTWDCPCHGSRFTSTGTCLSTPALQNIGDGERSE